MDNNSLTLVQAREEELKKQVAKTQQKAEEKIKDYKAKKEAELKNLPDALKDAQEELFAQYKKKLEQIFIDLEDQHKEELAKLGNVSQAKISKLADGIIKKVLA